ncbi:PilZ domain-containing protein [Mariprofundus sp. KV]|uniref:PilZ domain-containing protein n=1 Tax=Mariprofundus sp. KV TaxID=2608715 RepID=UPI0015A4E79A|nr:PilZ domain-containing protein [Mariprofundus sp. KV]NWF37011.1 hypothetical protein [Mariprofundus sp. KV]
MSLEQRRDSRNPAPEDMQYGKGFLCSSFECFEIELVKDISDHGIGLMADIYLGKGTAVQLQIPRSEHTEQIYGRVVWASPVAEILADAEIPLSYWIGISLEQGSTHSES